MGGSKVRYTPPAIACVTGTFIAGLVLVAGLSRYYPLPSITASWLLFVSFTLLAALSGFFNLNFSDRTRLGLSTMVQFAAVLLFNPYQAALICGLGAVGATIIRRSTFWGGIFNIGQTLLYVGLSGMVLHRFAFTPWLPFGVMAWVGMFLAAACLLGGNVLLVSGVVSVLYRRPFVASFRELASASLRQDVVLASLGMVAALLVRIYPWALAVILIPTVALFITLRRSRKVEEQQAQLLEQNRALVVSLQEQARQLQKAIHDLEDALNKNLEINTSLEDEVNQRKEAENRLTASFDAMLEGLSRALELRDQETERHSQRVTELALNLARRMGIPESEWKDLWRGGLMHDFGKIGIPDQILRKSTSLNEEEWGIMRRHPIYAFQWLVSIEFLRPALDIPYCHHEKWDGSGYPRGIKGEQIPLAARIFAVSDVWDALRSDRPYRPAWSDEQAREYIIAQSGKHFDPAVVEAFLGYLAERANKNGKPLNFPVEAQVSSTD